MMHFIRCENLLQRTRSYQALNRSRCLQNREPILFLLHHRVYVLLMLLLHSLRTVGGTPHGERGDHPSYAVAWQSFHFLLSQLPLESCGPIVKDMKIIHFLKKFTIFVRDTELPKNEKSSIKNLFVIV